MTRQRIRGFTLFELLAVLAIIGVIVLTVTLSLGNPRAERLQEAADRLAALVDLAMEEALFGAEDLALSFWQGGYAFHRLENRQWILVTDDDFLRARQLPEDVTVSLYLEGLEAELSPEPQYKPQVFILSSGELTPFELHIDDSYGAEVVLIADPIGNIQIQTQTL